MTPNSVILLLLLLLQGGWQKECKDALLVMLAQLKSKILCRYDGLDAHMLGLQPCRHVLGSVLQTLASASGSRYDGNVDKA